MSSAMIFGVKPLIDLFDAAMSLTLAAIALVIL